MNAVVANVLPDMENGLYKGKYSIYHPDTVAFVPRTKFLQGLVGHIDQGDALEDLLAKVVSKNTVEIELKEMAQLYIRLKNKGARLPNFTKWIMGMWNGNKEYNNLLAREGQRAAQRRIMLSTDLLDILRCADTPHFASCFKYTPGGGGVYGNAEEGRGYGWIPVRIAQECPGIGIAYVDDENGKMMGRQWMHHARITTTGEDICVLTEGHYGCLQGRNLSRLMAKKGVRVGYRTSHTAHPPVEFIGCFNDAVHHDLNTWTSGARVELIAPE